MKRNPKEVSNEEFPILNLLIRAGYFSEEELAEIEKNRKDPRYKAPTSRVDKKLLDICKQQDEMTRLTEDLFAGKLKYSPEFSEDFPEDDI